MNDYIFWNVWSIQQKKKKKDLLVLRGRIKDSQSCNLPFLVNWIFEGIVCIDYEYIDDIVDLEKTPKKMIDYNCELSWLKASQKFKNTQAITQEEYQPVLVVAVNQLSLFGVGVFLLVDWGAAIVIVFI